MPESGEFLTIRQWLDHGVDELLAQAVGNTRNYHPGRLEKIFDGLNGNRGVYGGHWYHPMSVEDFCYAGFCEDIDPLNARVISDPRTECVLMTLLAGWVTMYPLDTLDPGVRLLVETPLGAKSDDEVHCIFPGGRPYLPSTTTSVWVELDECHNRAPVIRGIFLGRPVPKCQYRTVTTPDHSFDPGKYVSPGQAMLQGLRYYFVPSNQALDVLGDRTNLDLPLWQAKARGAVLIESDPITIAAVNLRSAGEVLRQAVISGQIRLRYSVTADGKLKYTIGGEPTVFDIDVIPFSRPPVPGEIVPGDMTITPDSPPVQPAVGVIQERQVSEAGS